MLKESEIRSCAAELNEVFGLKPPIDTKTDIETLTSLLVKAVTYRKDDDIFTPAAIAVIEEFEAKGASVEVEKETPTYSEDELLAQVKSSMKLRELKDVAIANKEFKEIRGHLDSYKNVEELRGLMFDILLPRTVPSSKETKAPVEKTPPVEVKKEERKIKTATPTPASDAPVQDSTELRINPRFKAACPKLTDEEFNNLKELIIRDGEIFDPIITWKGQIVDGHNRFDVAKDTGILFTTREIEFDSEEDVIVWIKENAISQRNLTDFAKFEMMKEVENILLAIGKARSKASKNATGTEMTKGSEHRTRKELSKKSGISESQIKKAKVLDKNADATTKEKLRKGETTIGKEYEKVKQSKPISEFEQVELAAAELERWVDKYAGNPFLQESCQKMADFIAELREIPSF